MKSPIASLFLLGSLFSCSSKPESWNVLVLVPDTIRGDHLSVNGYAKKTSPRLDALAAEGTNFTGAFTAAPQTWQSFVTILTGLYPPHHGVRYIYDEPLSPSVPSMATLLSAEGYDTAAFDNIDFLRGMTGNRGFGEYILVDRERVRDNADETLLDQVWEWMASPREHPFFAFVRLSGAHWPYDNDLFLDEFEIGENLDHSFNRGGYGVAAGEPGEGHRLTDKEAHRRMVWLPERFASQRSHIIAHYDAEVREVDEHIGRLIERMREGRLLESTIVVVTSDHGESFGENGYMQHGPRLDEAVMRVPLIVRLPREHPDAKPGLSVEGVVRTADILPTVLHAARVPLPRNIDGVSLLPAMRGEPLPELWAYGETGATFMELDPELHLPGVAGKHRLVRTSDWKLIRVPGAENEYHLLKLPDDEAVLPGDHPAVVAELRAYLERMLATELEPSAESPLTPEELKTLKSLGYIH